jgi:ribosomal protein L37E
MNTQHMQTPVETAAPSWIVREVSGVPVWPPLRTSVTLGEQQTEMAVRALKISSTPMGAAERREPSGTAESESKPSITAVETCRYCGDVSFEVSIIPLAGGVLVNGYCRRCGVSGQSLRSEHERACLD